MAEKQENERLKQGAIKYKDVFEMSGDMAEQPISPRDAAAMRNAENRAFGKTLKGGPASIMLQAAARNVEAGLVDSQTSHQPLVEGDPWHESQPSHERMESAMSVEGMDTESAKGVTIGEALEAVAEAIGDKPVDHSDAAAIQIAEKIATGTDAALGSGLGAEAQTAATGATNMLTDDKQATKTDAERVKAAELRGGYEGVLGEDELRDHGVRQSTTPGGVAEAVESAARINQPDT
ncbi:Late embryogenesis abundant protein 32 [Bienertia sinuspersici]